MRLIQKKQKEKRNKKIIPKTSQDTLPFEYFYNNGIIYLGNSVYALCASFENIDYIMAKEEKQKSIFISYCNLLNSLDNNVKLQLF